LGLINCLFSPKTTTTPKQENAPVSRNSSWLLFFIFVKLKYMPYTARQNGRPTPLQNENINIEPDLAPPLYFTRRSLSRHSFVGRKQKQAVALFHSPCVFRAEMKKRKTFDSLSLTLTLNGSRDT
jgi:hypothetical protein